MKILLIEDDYMLSKALSSVLSEEGFAVSALLEGRDTANAVYEFEPEIIILDLGLPDMDGIHVLDVIRKMDETLPVLILTARDTVYDKVTALDKGADDYLAKPFDMLELLARIRAMARRIGVIASSILEARGLQMDLGKQQVKYYNKQVILTQKEFLILQFLMQNVGKVQTKDMLERKLYDWNEDIQSNTIEVHISNLRKKIPDKFIETIRGVGYMIKGYTLS